MFAGNPALQPEAFRNAAYAEPSANVMTLPGAVTKTAILVGLLTAAAAFGWGIGQSATQGSISPTAVGVLIGGLAVSLVMYFATLFVPRWSATTAPIYAVGEGLVLGALSAVLEARFPGIAIQAVALSIGTLIAMLAAYSVGLVRATENFKLGVLAATGAIGLVYLVSLGVHLFGGHMPYIHDAGAIGIGFSLVVVVIAALNLVLDFDRIEQGARSGAPKYMEWYAGFGLLITLVWLYLEVLRLLSKLRSRD